MNFCSFVDSEIQKALSPDCKRVAPDKLLGREPIRISYAFHSLPVNGKSKLINILVLPTDLKIDQYIEKQIIKLQDYILSKDCSLVVINEEDEYGSLGDTGIFVEENMAINNPNLLWVECYADHGYKCSVIFQQFEDLQDIICDLWNGSLRYKGPIPGYQQVNLEIMADECWSCHNLMQTVTGIVLPNKQLSRWDNTDWEYYNQLVPLSKLEGKNAVVIYDFVEKLRIRDRSITPVGDRYSQTIKSSYVAASCPHCGALRGDFHVNDYRMQYLHSLNNRLNGNLQYYSIGLKIDQEIINDLSSGYEGCDHTTGAGWGR